MIAETPTNGKDVDKEEKPAPVKTKWGLAIVVLLVQVTLSVMESQFSSVAFTTKEYEFNAQLFYTEWRFLSRSLAFPVVLLGRWIISLFWGKRLNVVEFIRSSKSIETIRLNCANYSNIM